MLYFGISCCLVILLVEGVVCLQQNLAWSGGPIHLECEHTIEMLAKSGQFRKENVIALKAVTFGNEIFVLTPRLKHGVLATVWLLVTGRHGVELQPVPDLSSHATANCQAIQNAVDFFLDHLGNIWVLDSGITDTAENPVCTCPPKIVTISIPLKKLTKRIELTSVTVPTSLLQNIVVEYDIGRVFVYVSDASRGAILVHDTLDSWLVSVSAPAVGLQLALVKRSLAHTALIIVRLPYPGLLELDTAALKRKNLLSAISAFGEQSKPVLLLGSHSRDLYLRHAECADVLYWNTRESYNESRLNNIYAPGPRLTPTSVAADPIKHAVLVLESNYGDTLRGQQSTYHRISFIARL